MELQLNEEQTAFVETVRKFLAAECPIPAVRALEHEPDGFDRSVWRRACELGWTSLLVSEDDGGGSLSEHGLADLALVAEEMGRAVAPGPLVPTNVVAGAVSRHGSSGAKSEVLLGLLDGTEIGAWCGPDPVTARTSGDTVVLDGIRPLVEAGAEADHLLVTFEREGRIGQAIVAVDAPGVIATPLDGLDLVRRFASIRFDGVVVEQWAVLGDPDADASADVERLYGEPADPAVIVSGGAG